MGVYLAATLHLERQIGREMYMKHFIVFPIVVEHYVPFHKMLLQVNRYIDREKDREIKRERERKSERRREREGIERKGVQERKREGYRKR